LPNGIVRKVQQNHLLSLIMRIPVPWVFVLVYLVGVELEQVCPVGKLPVSQRVVGLFGCVLLFVGVLIAGWGWLTFRRVRTTTVPGKISSQLVTWGPYRFTRNPMYVGLTLAYLGEAALLRQGWPVLVLPLVLAYVNWGVIRVEESKLEETFPSQYPAYRAKVRRWI
jgi:protein-S-isoprenylcysteine O-methyltransferase Ste14